MLNLIASRHDELIDKIIEAYREMEGCMQGTHCTVEIYPDGDIVTSGCLTQGSQTIASWEGESVVVAVVPAWEIGWSGYDYDFYEDVKYQDNYQELLTEYKAVADDYRNFYDFIEETHPEVIEQMDNDYKMSLFEDWFYEDANNQILRCLEDLQL